MIAKPTPARILELPQLGIPLDGEILEKCKIWNLGISISQHQQDCNASCIYDLDGRTGVALEVMIRNNSPCRAIRLDLRYIQIEIPWCQWFHWLEGPAKIDGREQYSLGGLPPRTFESLQALNHRLRRRELLFPGQELDGFLLGVGEGPISNDARDDQRFSADFSVYYQHGRVHWRRCGFFANFSIRLGPSRASWQRWLDQQMARDARAAQAAKEAAEKSSMGQEEVVADSIQAEVEAVSDSAQAEVRSVADPIRVEVGLADSDGAHVT
jgi:hypothetical protein